MKQLNGCSTPAPKSRAAKQWIKEEIAQTKEEDSSNKSVCSRKSEKRVNFSMWLSMKSTSGQHLLMVLGVTQCI